MHISRLWSILESPYYRWEMIGFITDISLESRFQGFLRDSCISTRYGEDLRDLDWVSIKLGKIRPVYPVLSWQ